MKISLTKICWMLDLCMYSEYIDNVFNVLHAHTLHVHVITICSMWSFVAFTINVLMFLLFSQQCVPAWGRAICIEWEEYWRKVRYSSSLLIERNGSATTTVSRTWEMVSSSFLTCYHCTKHLFVPCTVTVYTFIV